MLKSRRGFTLIEVMIVVAIVAILAAIALPAYSEQVRKSRRQTAIAEMERLQLALEQWRANNPTYASGGSGAVGTYPAVVNPSNYTIAISGQGTAGYVLTATATSGTDQAKDRAQGSSCATMTMTRSATGMAKSPTVCFGS